MNIEQARFNMIEQQIRPWEVPDRRVLEVMQTLPREAFVSPQQASLAFADLEIPIGHGQVMMSPKVEARLLQALRITATDDVLEIGTGSGFVTACLATMARHVTSCEYFADLSARARARLEKLQINNVTYIVGNAFELLADLQTYDAIAITGSLPGEAGVFSNLLKNNGRLFCIIGARPVMSATLVTRVKKGAFGRQSLFETDLPALLFTSHRQEFSF